MEADGALLLSVAMAGIAVLAALSYLQSEDEDPGLTTEIALIVTLGLGGLAARSPATAAALGVAVAILLAARAPMHRFIRDVLTAGELRSALILAAASLIVWPLLPDRHMGPLGAINPRSIWSVALVVMAVGAAGHIAVRAIGAGYGLPISGFASGFVSSSATIAAMGAKAAAEPKLLGPAVAAAVLSTVATVVQLILVIGAVSVPVLRALWLPLALGMLAAITYGIAFACSAASAREDVAPPTGQAFDPRRALVFAALVACVLVVSAAARTWLGERGLGLAAAAAGFADTHAIAISIASLVAGGKLLAPSAEIPILLAFTSNSATKIVMAAVSGNADFALRVIPGVLLVLAAIWTGWLLQ
jgi:uncharacterized membrane protein (DUF4010 family)